MSYDYKRVIQVAENEIGYLEKNDKSSLEIRPRTPATRTTPSMRETSTRLGSTTVGRTATPGVMCLWTGALCRPMG